MDSSYKAAKKDLIDDFSRVVSDAEALLKAARDIPGDKAQSLRASAEASLGSAKERLSALKEDALEKATTAARAADAFTHENAWPLIGAAALAGFVVGYLMRGSDEG
jgi:ElaB/YqjD/DUF883 family membrane-anchored ribosome-binding protein